ncbi:hypothetical protein CLG85_018125 [Yangia mangrovi]|uniref:Uncharacterized protein n=1 Tax=Alloyangia mangrovi TaxID=1779329 RepID=A0A2A3JNA8_9RHOB|nr:hypothetical protein [Alloyangia mangrovi]MCA0940207.1 hypothetical protein [Alloyangia pacifica]MCA0945657.1 hypothetical protein [Alloyangia pacifica]MCT4372125.1 hypothetical protein [Alloyangia mangrovi]
MAGALPEFFFRTRDNGALVFRVDGENRQRRIEMTQIAVVNLAKGEVRAHGEHQLTPEDLAAIGTWVEDRKALLARRSFDEMQRTIDQLNAAAQWAQSKASDAELDEVTDALLLAMHDLRGVLVRRRAEKLSREG